MSICFFAKLAKKWVMLWVRFFHWEFLGRWGEKEEFLTKCRIKTYNVVLMEEGRMKKRFELRRSIETPVEIITSFWDEPVDLIASDLSPRGAYLESELMPEPGEHVVCSLELEHCTRDFCFFGEVTRINLNRRKSDGGKPGFGIEFLDCTPLDRLAIREALRGVPPPVPGPRV